MTAETATERGADWKPTACILCECNCGILVKLGGEEKVSKRPELIRSFITGSDLPSFCP